MSDEHDESLAAVEVEQDWYFTFGCGQFHAGQYIVIHGTYAIAREQMMSWFGAKWSMQYPSAEAAGVERWGYRRLYPNEYIDKVKDGL